MNQPSSDYPSILLNLAGLRVAGGRSVAINLMRAWHEAGLADRVTVVGPEGVGYEREVPDGGRWIPLSGWRARGQARPWVDTFTLPRIIREVDPSVVLTLSNLACRIPRGARARQALQVMWPYAMYDDAEIWCRLTRTSRAGKRFKRAYLERTARRAEVLIAQTPSARERLLARLPISHAVVIPTAVSLPDVRGEPADQAVLERGRNWLCVSRYYPHKNLETLVDVAEILKREGRASTIVLTIDREQGAGAAALLDDIDRRGLASHIVSIGEVAMDAVPGLYGQACGVVLPTLLESYSQVFIEAMGYGVPLVTSDRDFARSACGSAPLYVDPLDPAAIADAMIRMETDPDCRDRHVTAGLEWAGCQPDWRHTARLYLDLCVTLSQDVDVLPGTGVPATRERGES